MGDVARFPRDDGYQDAIEWIVDRVLKPAIGSFITDPPDSEYQRQYLRALKDIDRHIRRKMVPETTGQ